MKKAIILNITFLLVFLGILIISNFITNFYGQTITFIFSFLSLILVALYIKIYFKIGYKPFSKIRKFQKKHCLVILSLFLLAILLQIIVNPLVNFSNIYSDIDLFLEIKPVRINLFIFFYTVLYSPLIEEFIFRKFLLIKNYKLTSFKWLSILSSSLLFAVIHLPSIIGVACTFFLGVICSLLYIETKEITISITFHAMYNVVAIILSDTFFDEYVKFLSILNFNSIYWMIWFVVLALFIYVLNYFLTRGSLSKFNSITGKDYY